MGGHSVYLREESGLDRRLVTIDTLPDNVLVKIFNFYVNSYNPRWYIRRNTWHALVRVCRRWRYLVFASPRSLNLQLDYSGHGPMSEMPDTWPVLPVVLVSSLIGHPMPDQSWNNRVATLESGHCSRICRIHISDMTKSRWERFAAAMQKPFPELTHLQVSVGLQFGDCDRYWNLEPVLPHSFLGGSAPRLQELSLGSIPFPSITKLLLSANGLIALSLSEIPDSGYFLPDAMAAALTVMTRLESLHLQFSSPRFRPDPASQPPPPSTRFVLPALTQLMFTGVYEYLEDMLSRIDAPLLYHLRIAFSMDLDFDVPQLHRLIGHAEVFKTFDFAEVLIFKESIRLSLYPKTGAVDHRRRLSLRIKCRELDWQLSSLAQVCSSSFPLISALEELEITGHGDLSSSHWKANVENAQWLELLEPFAALKNLYLTDGPSQRVCGALQELSRERATEVLPVLCNLFVRKFLSRQTVQEALKPFVSARQLSGHPVAIYPW